MSKQATISDFTFGRIQYHTAFKCEGCCVRYPSSLLYLDPEDSSLQGNVNGTHYFGNTTLACGRSKDGCSYDKTSWGIYLNTGDFQTGKHPEEGPGTVFIPDCGAIYMMGRIEYAVLSGAQRLGQVFGVKGGLIWGLVGLVMLRQVIV